MAHVYIFSDWLLTAINEFYIKIEKIRMQIDSVKTVFSHRKRKPNFNVLMYYMSVCVCLCVIRPVMMPYLWRYSIPGSALCKLLTNISQAKSAKRY